MIVVVPLLILFFILAQPFILAREINAAISLRKFRRRESGCVYLICTSKRSWHDFLRNNVIPILPNNIRVVWHKSEPGYKQTDIFACLSRAGLADISKPFMVLVTPHALLHRSLNVPLQSLKACSKRSSDIRQKCATIIKDIEGELRAAPSLPYRSLKNSKSA
jgi:hypothetical protein